jgi:predicted nucleic-acid-binding protein
MRAVDTNLLVRLVTRDHPEQTAATEAFVAAGAWVSHLVLMEAMWVLDSVYGLGPEKIATAVEMLLNHRDLTIQEPDTVTAALRHFQRWGSGSVSLGLPLGEGSKSSAPAVPAPRPKGGRGKLTHYQRWPALGFSDCLILAVARKAGHLPLGTFDRDLGKIEGTQRL